MGQVHDQSRQLRDPFLRVEKPRGGDCLDRGLSQDITREWTPGFVDADAMAL